MQNRLIAERYWLHSAAETIVQALWSVTYAAMFTIVQVTIVGCVVLSVFVAEAFRKDLLALFGLSGQQADPTIQLSCPLLVATAILTAICLTLSTSRILFDRKPGSSL
jgi:hypothetical protein